MRYFVVDAFADRLFQGNPAGVCLVESPLDDAVMQSIAAENNLAETAFVMPWEDGYCLRWFTPEVEIDLCGHATLASAFVLSRFESGTPETLRFHTRSGLLTVTKQGDLFTMDFPARKPRAVPVLPMMEQALGCPVKEAHMARDCLLLVDGEETVRSLKPDMELLRRIPDTFAVIVTARGNEADFVSRFFAPNAGVPEDPVTGSSHATLIPFWAGRLGKKRMTARQLSKRGGTLYCEDCGDRVNISGKAVLYLSGEIHGPEQGQSPQ